MDTLSVIVPFFAVILLGFLAARFRIIPMDSVPGLNAFVLYIALPGNASRPLSADSNQAANRRRIMGALTREHGTTILHITHDLALAARTCDRIVVMADGGLVEQGRTQTVLRDPQHETTRRLLAAALRGAGAVGADRRAVEAMAA